MATSITNTSISTDTINVDNGVLYVDNTSNCIGINKTNPVYNVDVSGRVRIDNSDTNASLYVTRNAPTTVTADADIVSATAVYINGNEDSGSDALRIGSMQNAGKYFIDVSNYNATANYDLLLQPLRGNVGVGVTNAESTLHVGGSATISNDVGYYAANLTEASDYRMAFRISPTRAGYTKGITMGALGSAVRTGIQAYDTSDNSANNLELNPLGGPVKMAYQPAFSATGFSAHRYMNTWQNVALNNWNVVNQSSASAYDNSTGRFTASTDGMYFFIYTSMFQNTDSNDFHNVLKVNDANIIISNNHAGGAGTNGHTWNDCTVSGAVYLAAGDYVTCASTGSNSSTCFLYGSGSSSRYSNFSGWLIG